jgi:hypothetical protein
VAFVKKALDSRFRGNDGERSERAGYDPARLPTLSRAVAFAKSILRNHGLLSITKVHDACVLESSFPLIWVTERESIGY